MKGKMELPQMKKIKKKEMKIEKDYLYVSLNPKHHPR